MLDIVDVAFLLVGAGLGVGLYRLIVVRWLRPRRRRLNRAYQLADAQERHERRRIASGPMFARAAQHLTRITERAELVLSLMEAGRYDDAEAEIKMLLRHCAELSEHMKPKRRRDDPETWNL